MLRLLIIGALILVPLAAWRIYKSVKKDGGVFAPRVVLNPSSSDVSVPSSSSRSSDSAVVLPLFVAADSVSRDSVVVAGKSYSVGDELYGLRLLAVGDSPPYVLLASLPSPQILEVRLSAPLETPDLAVPLEHVSAAEVVERIGTGVVGAASGSSVVVRADADQVSLVRAAVAAVDTQSQIVSVRAVIVTEDRDSTGESGLFGFFERIAAGANGSGGIADQLSRVVYDVGSGVVTLGGSYAVRHFFELFVSQIEREKNLRLVASPSVAVMSGSDAVMSSGRQIPIPVRTRDVAGSTSSVEYRNAELSLKVSPVVLPSGAVRVKVAQTLGDVVGSASIGGDAVPIIGVQTASTVVEIVPGQLLVLGGIEQTTSDKDARGTPYVRRIPVLGWVLGAGTRSKKSRNVYVILSCSFSSDPEIRAAKRAPSGHQDRFSYGKGQGSNPTSGATL